MTSLVVPLAFAVMSQNAPTNLPSRGPIALPPYPRIMAFRLLEGGWAKKPGGLDIFKNYDLIHATPGTSDALRKVNQDSVQILHWRFGMAAKPGIWTNNFRGQLALATWPGHWLLYNGTTITAPLRPAAEDSVIAVQDTSVFVVENRPRYGPDDLMIYALDEAGKPVWEHSEHCKLVAIDADARTITVQRGQYRSRPLSFEAGRAVVATHATPQLRSHTDPNMWRLNFSLESPRDPEGRTAAEASADFMASLLRSKHIYADGVEFDVGDWSGRAFTANQQRGVDVNNDLVRDNCFVHYPGLGPVNSLGLGTIVFTKRLRDAMGPNFLIQADCGSTRGGWRGFIYANGVEIEGFPSFGRPETRNASMKFNLCAFAASRAGSEPKASYLFVKRPTEAYAKDPSQFKGTNSIFRLGFAGDMMIDGIIPYASVDDTGGFSEERGLGFGAFCWWDEYDAGKLKRRHYLGMPLEPPKHLGAAADGPNLLAPMQDAKLVVQPGYEAGLTREPANGTIRVQLEKMPASPSFGGVRLEWPLRMESFAGPDEAFTLRMRVRAETGYDKIGPLFKRVPRALNAAVGTGLGLGRARDFYADADPYALLLILYPSLPKNSSGRPALFLQMGEEPGVVEIGDISICRGDGFVMYRRFEGGIVLMNGSLAPVTFDLQQIDPGRTLSHIDGIVTPAVNTGKLAQRRVTVGPHDGLVLICPEAA